MAARLVRFEHHRYLGDKRTFLVHDQDNATDACGIAELGTADGLSFAIAFGPDVVAEARNRGYRPCRSCLASVESATPDDDT